MEFSLILATLGRSTELSRFLYHLAEQTYTSIELIVIDQNQDDILSSVLEPYRNKFPINHLKSSPGLSKARNLGLKHASGKIITFPDDDCWYPRDLLYKLRQFFIDYPEIHGFTGRSVDENGLSLHKFDRHSGYLTKLNTWTRTSSIALFFRAEVVERVGYFDETLGLGSGTLWGASEDVDYPLRVLTLGYRLYYDPDIVVYHPYARQAGYETLAKRAFQYGAGIGRVWKKHDFPLWFVSYHLARPVGGALLSLIIGNRSKAGYHWQSFLGRWTGWNSKLLTTQ
jgi:glycosyltransferase involved in cell wall biosynthesis